MSKHNHHTADSLLVKFIRRGDKIVKEKIVFPEIKKKIGNKKEVVAILMESPLYAICSPNERLENLRRFI